MVDKDRMNSRCMPTDHIGVRIAQENGSSGLTPTPLMAWSRPSDGLMGRQVVSTDYRTEKGSQSVRLEDPFRGPAVPARPDTQSYSLVPKGFQQHPSPVERALASPPGPSQTQASAPRASGNESTAAGPRTFRRHVSSGPPSCARISSVEGRLLKGATA